MKNFKNPSLSIITAFSLLLLSLLILWLNPFPNSENKTTDTLFQLRGTITPHVDIVIVELDEASLQAMNRKWPWDRSLFAAAIQRISQDQPKVIALDFTFAEPGTPAEDNALRKTIDTITAPVVAGIQLSSEIKQETHNQKELIFIQETPLKPIFTKMLGGFLNIPVDSDGVIRRCPIWLSQGDIPYPAFALQIAGNLHPALLLQKEYKKQNQKPFLINFAGPAGTFPRLSLYQVLQNLLPAHYFKDKIVLLGPSFSASQDFHRFPFSDSSSPASHINGVEIHANLLNNILKGNFLNPLSPYLSTLIFLFFFSALFLLFHFVRKKLLLGSLISLLLISYSLFAYIFFKTNILLPFFTPFLLLLLETLALAAIKFYTKYQLIQINLSGLQEYDLYAMELFAKKYDITRKEKDIIVFVLKNVTNKEISEKLFVSINTVKKHISNIYKKLEVNSREDFLALLAKEKVA